MQIFSVVTRGVVRLHFLMSHQPNVLTWATLYLWTELVVLLKMLKLLQVVVKMV